MDFMAGAESWDQSMSSLTHWFAYHCMCLDSCHKPDCVNLAPVLLTWHSTLYNRFPPYTTVTQQIRLLGEGWARYRAAHKASIAASSEAHSFSQAPSMVLPLCTAAIAVSVSY
jgi:hypothetical protein